MVLHRPRCLHVLADAGPKAGLYTALYYTVPVFSFLRAPSRAGIVVTLCLVVLAAPALSVLMRRRATSVGVRDPLRAGGRRSLSRAAAHANGAATLQRVYDARPLPRGPVIELPYWSDERGLSPARGIYAAVHRSLAAAGERLQRSHSPGLSRQRAAAQRVSEPRFVRHSRKASAPGMRCFTST